MVGNMSALLLLFMLLFLVCKSSAVIYKLNNTDYVRMPPVHHLDPYETCIHQKDGLYCTVEVDLVTDGKSELLDMIQKYSERRETHFNHSRLHHGICVSKMCNELLKQNMTTDLKLIIEECLNSSFWENYKLKTRINEEIICNDQDVKFILDSMDIAVAVICLSLVILNIIGTIYDFFITTKDFEGNTLLLCFSVKRSWLKLTSPVANDKESRIKRLKGLNGLRAITIFFVIIEHALLPFVVAVDNTHVIEDAYGVIAHHLLLDGTLVVQTFFIISGCLLAYHLQLTTEEEDLNWKIIPKGILLRWLRLTPPYAIVLAVTATWFRFAGSGPIWQKIVAVEVEACRREGWLNLIYLNNYFGDLYCMKHTWYLATEVQLFVLGIFTLVLVRSNRTRKVVLVTMFTIGVIIPALHTYFQNLDTFIIVSPETARSVFVQDPTFNNVYKRAHTNMANYVLGLGLGLSVYELQKKEFEIGRFKKFKYFYWATVPLGIVLILCNSLFYMDGATVPLVIKAMYSGLLKGVIGLLGFVFIFGMVFKIENVFRGILEWHGWTSPARVSYSAYILHVILVQTLTASRTTLIHYTLPQMIFTCIGASTISYIIAYPFCLLVEVPLTQFSKLMVNIPTRDKNKRNPIFTEVVKSNRI